MKRVTMLAAATAAGMMTFAAHSQEAPVNAAAQFAAGGEQPVAPPAVSATPMIAAAHAGDRGHFGLPSASGAVAKAGGYAKPQGSDEGTGLQTASAGKQPDAGKVPLPEKEVTVKAEKKNGPAEAEPKAANKRDEPKPEPKATQTRKKEPAEAKETAKAEAKKQSPANEAAKAEDSKGAVPKQAEKARPNTPAETDIASMPVPQPRPEMVATARKAEILVGSKDEMVTDRDRVLVASIKKGAVDKAAALGAGEKYHEIVARYASAYGVPVSLAHAVIAIESNYRPDARGSAGEIGLMQIKPSTARLMGYTGSAEGLYHPETNIKFGMKYLSKARKLGGGDTCGTILRYNAGHGASTMNPVSAAYCTKVKRHLGKDA